MTAPRFPHGTYDPQRGWYDASLRVWVAGPGKLTKTGGAARPSSRTALDGYQYRDTPRSTAEAVELSHSGWRPNPQLEQLRRLRDADRPEDRATAERLLKGTQRIAMGDYEAGLAAHLAAGGELPDGVIRP